jgi:hypothetical protein
VLNQLLVALTNDVEQLQDGIPDIKVPEKSEF